MVEKQPGLRTSTRAEDSGVEDIACHLYEAIQPRIHRFQAGICHMGCARCGQQCGIGAGRAVAPPPGPYLWHERDYREYYKERVQLKQVDTRHMLFSPIYARLNHLTPGTSGRSELRTNKMGAYR